jgi:hypothetical protein
MVAQPRPMSRRGAFSYFKTSPENIRQAVMM